MPEPVVARRAVFAPLQVEGAVEQIVRRIGEAIGSGLLEPGERLPPEAELATLLEVAPMTLRQALAVLRDAGYVETRRGNGGGSFVTADIGRPLDGAGRPPTADALRDLTDWRRAVSGEAAALAAERASDTARARISDRAEEAESAAVELFTAFRISDSRFHLAIAEATGSPRLVAAETGIQAELGAALRAIPAPSLARLASTSGHQPLVAAILDGDPPAARRALERHVEATHDWIVGLRLGRMAER